MDVVKQLKHANSTGKLIFGQKQTNAACVNGQAKLVFFAANCPEEFINALAATHSGVVMYRLNLVNRELGAACGKPFSVSAVALSDVGRSELLSLKSNI